MSIMDKMQTLHNKVINGHKPTKTEAQILINEALESEEYWDDQSLNHEIVVEAVNRLFGHVAYCDDLEANQPEIVRDMTPEEKHLEQVKGIQQKLAEMLAKDEMAHQTPEYRELSEHLMHLAWDTPTKEDDTPLLMDSE